MDVNIAVSLMRGQMGTVVEKAVSAAVETVLAEMLKVVGLKFDELKREMVAKEKENETIRHMLDYSRCQVKTMRKYLGQAGGGTGTGRGDRLTATYQRSAVGQAEPRRPHGQSAAPRGGTLLSSGLSLGRTNGNPQQPCSSSSSSSSSSSIGTSRNRITLPQQPDAGLVRPFDSHDLTRMVSQAMAGDSSTAVSAVSKAPEPLKEEHSSNTPEAAEKEEDSGQLREEEEEEAVCVSDWISQQPTLETLPDPTLVLSPPAKTDGADGGSILASGSRDTRPPPPPLPPPPQVKEEVEEVEVFCIKEEPEEVVVASLLLDCEGQEIQENHAGLDWAGPMGQRSFTEHTGLTAGHCTYSLAPPPTVSGGRPLLRPWPKDLSLYEEYKLRRAELRRRSQTRRREMEKTLPQPLLQDLVRERREKTRLRVARWRAKRKLQACLMTQQAPPTLHQAQLGGLSTQQNTLGLNTHLNTQNTHKTTTHNTGPPGGHQRGGSSSSLLLPPQYGDFLYNRAAHCDMGASADYAMQFNSASSSSSSSLLLGQLGPNVEVVGQSAVTSHHSQQQSLTLVTDSDLYQ